MGGVALGQASPAPSASPSPSATPAAPSDPCGSILSIVNRPTVTTGVCTVRTGHFDIENGYTNTTTTGLGGGSGVNYPQSLIRVGTADPHFDLEFGPPSYETSSAGTPTVTGASDVNLGVKYEVGYSSNADWGRQRRRHLSNRQSRLYAPATRSFPGTSTGATRSIPSSASPDAQLQRPQRPQLGRRCAVVLRHRSER